ncbi:diguanylate cyclase domain-containing protein [Spirochaetota bacterium]
MNLLLANSTKPLYEAVNKSIKGTDINLKLSEDIESIFDDIHKHTPQVVIINQVKGNFDLISICKKIRRLRKPKYISIIIITKREMQKGIGELIKAGVDDFIFKPFSKEELALRIGIAKKNMAIQNSLKNTKKKLIRLSTEDSLTGLLNRRALYDEILREMGRASREMKFVSTVMVEILEFDHLMEKYGSEIANDILVKMSRRLKLSCRPYDKVGRYSPIDFVVFIPDSNKGGAQKVANRILPELINVPYNINGNNISIKVNVGISELNSDDVVRRENIDDILMNEVLMDTMIKQSEFAVQNANEKGSGIIEVYSG